MASTGTGVWVVARTAGENTQGGLAKLGHPSHSHPLAFCYKYPDGVSCQECGQPLPPGGRAYGCEDCGYYLHFPCLREVHSPLHPQHPLIVRIGQWGHSDGCQICVNGTLVGLITFHCEPCNLRLCMDCVSLAPTWRFEHEGHHFVSIEIGVREDSTISRFYRGRGIRDCPVCGKRIDNKFFKCLSPGCLNFCHFQCIPFDVPKSIKHLYHYHPLSFTEPYAEDGRDEHYCDACEEERDPKVPVYRCEDCNFTAHTSCAISQVLPTLIAEREANPWTVSVPFCIDPVGPVPDELNVKIEGLLAQEKSLMKDLERIEAEIEEMEKDYRIYAEGRTEHDM
ncbi:uncharacterized protein LOC116210163 [Punica granatum]|uniref:Uncharacterized protein LOC116189804 n=2 Tax=Punica granatum TaxID=22663 RepID=A0A6P8DZW0_PUNGR|nr:uncharacterized protein LOC116189804 [Punica granatum]XP_031399844.1 uncharacterized protein LOC116210163 [Punica granatum]PKI69620.1 hypothetical protein CRG98_009975 [Punica granatum]